MCFIFIKGLGLRSKFGAGGVCDSSAAANCEKSVFAFKHEKQANG
jgi:hypothetical protein